MTKHAKGTVDPANGWSKAFIEMLGTWDEEIELPPQTPISQTRDPFANWPDECEEPPKAVTDL
jgi:hypothetical protein